jgi:hypothetical protein
VCPAEWGDRLGDYFSDLKFSKAPKSGHFVHYEQAALSNAEMLAFFRPLAAAPPGPDNAVHAAPCRA